MSKDANITISRTNTDKFKPAAKTTSKPDQKPKRNPSNSSPKAQVFDPDLLTSLRDMSAVEIKAWLAEAQKMGNHAREALHRKNQALAKAHKLVASTVVQVWVDAPPAVKEWFLGELVNQVQLKYGQEREKVRLALRGQLRDREAEVGQSQAVGQEEAPEADAGADNDGLMAGPMDGQMAEAKAEAGEVANEGHMAAGRPSILLSSLDRNKQGSQRWT